MCGQTVGLLESTRSGSTPLLVPAGLRKLTGRAPQEPTPPLALDGVHVFGSFPGPQDVKVIIEVLKFILP